MEEKNKKIQKRDYIFPSASISEVHFEKQILIGSVENVGLYEEEIDLDD